MPVKNDNEWIHFLGRRRRRQMLVLGIYDYLKKWPETLEIHTKIC